MDMGMFRAVLTVVLLAAFVGLWVWAWSQRRKVDFDEAARLPLHDDGPIPQGGPTSSKGEGHE